MIEFDDLSHTYRVAGKVLPSVTQILGVLNDFSKVPWQVLEAARERGSLVHAAGELMLQDRLDWSSIDSEIQAYLIGLQKFVKESGAVITGTERRVYHPEQGYAGTLDAIVHWRNGYALVDWKTSVAAPKSVGPQLAAYGAALNAYTGQRIPRHYCVRLLPGEYKVDRVDDPKNWSIFQSCLNLWRFSHAA